jgi:hypothetical protein
MGVTLIKYTFIIIETRQKFRLDTRKFSLKKLEIDK